RELAQRIARIVAAVNPQETRPPLERLPGDAAADEAAGLAGLGRSLRPQLRRCSLSRTADADCNKRRRRLLEAHRRSAAWAAGGAVGGRRLGQLGVHARMSEAGGRAGTGRQLGWCGVHGGDSGDSSPSSAAARSAEPLKPTAHRRPQVSDAAGAAGCSFFISAVEVRDGFFNGADSGAGGGEAAAAAFAWPLKRWRRNELACDIALPAVLLLLLLGGLACLLLLLLALLDRFFLKMDDTARLDVLAIGRRPQRRVQAGSSCCARSEIGACAFARATRLRQPPPQSAAGQRWGAGAAQRGRRRCWRRTSVAAEAGRGAGRGQQLRGRRHAAAGELGIEAPGLVGQAIAEVRVARRRQSNVAEAAGSPAIARRVTAAEPACGTGRPPAPSSAADEVSNAGRNCRRLSRHTVIVAVGVASGQAGADRRPLARFPVTAGPPSRASKHGRMGSRGCTRRLASSWVGAPRKPEAGTSVSRVGQRVPGLQAAPQRPDGPSRLTYCPEIGRAAAASASPTLLPPRLHRTDWERLLLWRDVQFRGLGKPWRICRYHLHRPKSLADMSGSLPGYPKYELLLCVQDEQDPVIGLVNNLRERFPNVDCRLFIGGKDGIVNPMVHNMVPAYENAKYDLVWVSTSRIRASTPILMDLVARAVQDPTVAIVHHQLPFMRNDSVHGMAAIVEKVAFGCNLGKQYLSLSQLGTHIFTGMSYLVRKPYLDKVGGLAYYGRYLAEDFCLSRDLLISGYQLVLSAFPAETDGCYGVSTQLQRSNGSLVASEAQHDAGCDPGARSR
uniref:ceramide glucosyltransferase n=1 Tax=Macrostomum lignano TaxID=282301 RepID=A0A1I8FIR2_9PLAT